ncbi:hypothetical protein OIO90_000045 [Microbotryomycetes sp. JL221]|nr:hypothetical protein OIO90_000045 [Microbotryomycetes sp. JL221]
MSRANSDQLAALQRFTTCEVSDALTKLSHPGGGYVPDLEVFSQGEADKGTIVGEAYTMIDPSKEPDAPKLKEHWVDTAPSGSIIVISTPPHVKSASLGGLLAAGAQVRGVQAVVIDGRCRDLQEIRDMKLPVFARGHSTLGQSPFTRPSAIQVPIEIKPVFANPDANTNTWPSITVNPHDIVLADVDGVVVVPPSLIDQVIELTTKGKEVDDKTMIDILAGKGVKASMDLHRGQK